MELQSLVDRIVTSERTVWNKINTSSGPESHHAVAAYMPDVSITLAWGLRAQDRFLESWANVFLHADASAEYADVLYHGALVHRELYVVVDEGHAFLPRPLHAHGDAVPLACSEFVRLLDELSAGTLSHYSSYCERAGLRVVDAPWPDWWKP